MKRETTVTVVEFASRLDLTQRILDFCGSFSIYNVEVTSLHVNDRSIQVPAGM